MHGRVCKRACVRAFNSDCDVRMPFLCQKPKGCLLYAINVPYGIGKCAVDKMSSTMAIELVTEGIDVVSWWAKEPMQTDEIKAGNVDGTTWRRGQLPGIAAIAPRLDDLYHSALAGTLFYEGRTLAAFARDHGRAVYSGTAVQTGHLARKYGVVDERGLRSPSFMSIKSVLFLFIPQLRTFADIPKPPPCKNRRDLQTRTRLLFQSRSLFSTHSELMSFSLSWFGHTAKNSKRLLPPALVYFHNASFSTSRCMLTCTYDFDDSC